MLESTAQAANGPSTSSFDLFTDLQIRVEKLLNEFRSYQTHLRSQNKQQDVEVRAFKRGVESEVKTLGRLRLAFDSNPSTTQANVDTHEGHAESPQLHALKSSNLPFYEAVWDVAKSCRSITSLGKKMYLTEKVLPSQRVSGEGSSSTSKRDRNSLSTRGVIVDIVAGNGSEWIKVSTLTEKRLLFDMAKEGWEKYDDSSDDSDFNGSQGGRQRDGDGGSKMELVRLAEDLKAAAQRVRVQYRHPSIRFVLPKIRKGVLEDVDRFLADLRATGAVVQCSNDMDEVVGRRELDLDQLMPSEGNNPLTSTINVDCTILLALISDISHLSRSQLSADATNKSQHYHKAIMNQIEAERSMPMLPTETYPLFAGRNLECSAQAAQRMREIVQCMGTPSELKRAEIILGEAHYKSQASASLQEAIRGCSVHAVPGDLRLPVRVIHFEVQALLSTSPGRAPLHGQPLNAFPVSVAARAKDRLRLSPVNASVFLYGWSRQITTFTSNRAVATALVKTINDVLDEEEREGHSSPMEFVGPLIYTCETARSLIGKAKFNEEAATVRTLTERLGNTEL